MCYTMKDTCDEIDRRCVADVMAELDRIAKDNERL